MSTKYNDEERVQLAWILYLIYMSVTTYVTKTSIKQFNDGILSKLIRIRWHILVDRQHRSLRTQNTIPLSRSGYSQSSRIHQRQNFVPERLLGPVSEQIEKLSLGQAALQAIISISFPCIVLAAHRREDCCIYLPWQR